MRLKGFKNSPPHTHIHFAEALYQDLAEFHQKHPKVNLLQNVDDLLIVAKEKSFDSTTHVLWTLHQLGYKVSATKAQLCTER